MYKIPKDKLFVQVPYEDLLAKLWLILLFKINCEIYIKPKLIDSCRDIDLERVRAAFERNGISSTAHAPIYDPYEEGFEIFKESYLKTSRFCRMLGITTIVMHIEYESKKSPSIDGWLKESIETWRWIGEKAEVDGITVLLENHNESSAEPIVRVINETGSCNLMACLDVGHFNAFGKKELPLYLDDYPAGSIKEVHLSDNLGDGDTHLPLGRGNIDFLRFFEAVEAHSIDPICTIEAKDLWGIIAGIKYLKRIGAL